MVAAQEGGVGGGAGSGARTAGMLLRRVRAGEAMMGSGSKERCAWDSHSCSNLQGRVGQGRM